MNMNNFIEVLPYRSHFNITKEAMDKMNSVIPKGCPYQDYTLLNLLFDFIKMYSYKVSGKMSLEDFIKKLQEENYEIAAIYGNCMISMLS